MTGRIEKIELSNFGPFPKKIIEFPEKKKYDINIIIGENSFGKSSLLNSFKWTLYGDIEGDSSAFKYEGAKGAETKVKFSIQKDEHLVTLSRSDKHGESCTVLDADHSSLPSDFEQETHNLLPKVVKDFFLFRGEFLSNLFEQYNSEELKTAILKLSKIDRFSIIRDAIEKNEETYREEAIKVEKSNVQLRKHDEKIRQFQESIHSARTQIEEMTEQIKKLSKKKNDANQKLLEMTRNEGELNEKIRTKTNLETTKQQLVDQLRSKEPEIKELFAAQLSDGLVAKQISQYIQKITELEKDGKVPPRVDPQMLQESIKVHKCALCQSKLDKDMQQKLDKLLVEVKKAKKNMPLYRLSERCATRMETLQGDVELFEYRLKEYLDLSSKRDDTAEKIKKLQDQIGLDSEGQDEIQRLTAQIESQDREIHQLSAETQRLNESITDWEVALGDAQGKFNRAKSKGSMNSEIEFKSRVVSELREELDTIYTQLKRNLAKSLQSETKNFYDQIFSRIYKESRYDIVVSDDFSMKVLSKQKYDRLAEDKLSTGEYKVLSLSFLLALSKYYDFEFPIVIDAPFSDLGTPLRRELVQALLNLSQEKQVIIFTLPNLENDIMKELKKNANVIYQFTGPGDMELLS